MSADRSPWLIALAGIAVLGTAFASQYLGGLVPCELCIWQRWPWGAAIVLALAAAVAPGRPRGWLLGAAGTAVLAGAAIAFYHVGVEQHWWQGPTACTFSLSQDGDVATLRERLLATPMVRCDQPAWTLLGVSMAGFNLLASLVVGIAAVAAALRPVAGRRA